MIFLLLRDADVEALALLRQYMEQERMVVVLRKIERLDQVRQIVAINRPVVGKAHLLENQARPMPGREQALDRALRLQRELLARLAAETLHQLFHAAVQVRIARVRHDIRQVLRNRAHVLVDRPLVVVQDDNQPLRMRRNIIERLVGNAAGKRRIAAQRHHVLRAALQVARRRHAQRRRERRARVTRAEAVVLALGPQHEAVQDRPAGEWC